jgi:hypothetical protein
MFWIPLPFMALKISTGVNCIVTSSIILLFTGLRLSG